MKTTTLMDKVYSIKEANEIYELRYSISRDVSLWNVNVLTSTAVGLISYANFRNLPSRSWPSLISGVCLGLAVGQAYKFGRNVEKVNYYHYNIDKLNNYPDQNSYIFKKAILYYPSLKKNEEVCIYYPTIVRMCITELFKF